MTDTKENRLDSPINIHKIPLNNTKYYQLDEKQNWLKDLLLELNEKADGKSAEEYLDLTHVNLELELTKKFKHDTGEFLLLKGKFSTKYVTQCVRTLEDMFIELELKLQTCFISIEKEEEDIFKDQLETFQENEMYELYFYEKNQVNLAEMLHEQVFLNMNQYPVKDADVPLPESGTQH